MEIICIAWLAGVALIQWAPALPDPLAWAGLVLGGGVGLIYAMLAPPGRGRRPALVLAALLLGGAYTAWRAELRLADALPLALEGQEVEVSGVVASLPQSLEKGVRFVFEVEPDATPASIPVPRRLLLAWYRGWQEDEWYGNPQVHAGERWRFTLRLRRPHGSVNPDGFDFEAWLLEQDLRATGQVRPGKAQRLEVLAPGLGYRIEHWREVIRQRFLEALPDKPYAGVLIALAVGDQRAIPPAQWQMFATTGIAHLVAISGMHITLLAALLGRLVHGLWARFPALVLRWPARQAAVLAGALGAWAYCLLAGWGIPAQRTLYMLAVGALALLLRRELAAGPVLALALGVVLLIDPWAVLAPGFWLSFGAVACLFWALGGRLGAEAGWRAGLRTQWVVTLGLLPAMLILFQQFSLVSPLANALAVPLISFLVTPLALAYALLPLQMLADLAHGLLAWGMVPVEWLARWPGAQWQQARPPLALVLLALPGCLWLLLPRGTPARWLGGLLLVPLVGWTPPRPAPGSARVTLLDVGQGLAVHVATAGHDLVYDAGPAFSAEANSGERILLPYLRAQGVRQLDEFIITHPDQDHAGGAESVFLGLPVARVRASLPASHPVRLMAGGAYQPCAAGQRWVWDGVGFEVLSPRGAVEEGDERKTNAWSCVLRIDAAGQRLLLTADMEAPTEAELVAADPAALAADVVVVPHHGSRTSSTPPFIAATGARWALFPVGYRNRFHHPHPKVWAAWGAAGAERLRTDQGGALRIHMESDGLRVEPWRTVEKRYWRD